MIEVSGLAYCAPRSTKRLLELESLRLEVGGFHAFLGPNGAGKSTLLRCLCGEIRDFSGTVTFAGENILTYHLARLARQRAVLPQLTTLPFAMPVRDIVAFGRDVYHRDTPSQHNDAVVEQVMTWLDITSLAEKNYQQLSGGEQHRVQIARTLAQVIAAPDASLAGQVLFLDEPTNHLDIRHQYTLMALLSTLRARGLSIVCVLHDIALALNYADTLLLLQDGMALGHFTPMTLVNDGALNRTYGLDLQAHWSEYYRRYVVMPVMPENTD